MRSAGFGRAQRRNPWALASSAVARCALVLASLWLVGGAARLEAQGDDYGLDNRAWNGLSAFVQLAQDEGVAVEPVDTLDVGTLRPNDALIILYPMQGLPAEGLTGFLRAGGRIALADDFGHGDELLRVFHIQRTEPHPSSVDVLRLRGNPQLLVARAGTRHPLAEGVSSIVTNHARVLFHSELEPVFAFVPHEAVVLAGAVGAGRLVAIGDGSIFINNMMELEGNRRFAANVLHYLAAAGPEGLAMGQSGGGRVLLVGPRSTLLGRFGEPGADRPLHDVRALLERLSDVELPPAALRALSVSVFAFLILLAVSVLPRESPYRAAAMFREEVVSGGLVGRVAWYRARPSDLLEPTLVLQRELEARLARELGLPPRARADEVAASMRSLGMSASAIDATRSLLDELAGLASGATNGTAPPVSASRFLSIEARARAAIDGVVHQRAQRPVRSAQGGSPT